MSMSLETATDAMFSRVKAVLDSDINVVLGYVPETRWPYVAEPDKPDNKRVWFRVSTQIVIERQSTLSTFEGSKGQRLYETTGLLFIEAYIPKTIKNVSSILRTASLLRNAFRNAPSSEGVRYYNARVNDGIAPEELFYRFNVVTEFEYDEKF